MEVIVALARNQMTADVLWRQQQRDGLPSGIYDESGLRLRSGGKHLPRANRESIDRTL
jgi:hypothetical protein